MFHRIRPPDRGDYIVFIFIGTGFGSVSAFGYALYLETGSRYAAALTLAAAMGLLLTWVQKRAYDRHVWLAANPIYIDDQPTPTPEPLQQVNTEINSGRHVRWGIWLTANEWQRIARATIKNGNVINRELCMSASVTGFRMSESGEFIGWFDRGKKESRGWGDFCYWLTGQGILKPAASNQQKELTEVGIAAFMELATPPTPQANE